eukprot:CFRG4251T1
MSIVRLSENSTSRMKIVVVGPGGVGKSAITLAFVRNMFLEEYDPTIEDSYSKTTVLDSGDVEVDITDTAGQEEFREMWGDKHIANGDGFLLVYSIIDETSFEDLQSVRKQIERVQERCNVPMVICANKCDLDDQREISKEAGETFAEESGAYYLETSAKTRFNVEEAFHMLIEEVQKTRKVEADIKANEDSVINNKSGKTKGGREKGKGTWGKSRISVDTTSSDEKKKKKGGCTIS